MKQYPEHEKLKQVSGKSQTVGTFLDWLVEQKSIELAVRHEHTEHCYEQRERVNGVGTFVSSAICCGYGSGDLVSARIPFRQLLAEFFEIDEEKIETEKREMLEELRKR